ncbi:unnamed protein product [Toxocara canis]|uniref:Uncharacterized protein n=1 Tax=Toxocara canis TaxID=6265 RepID=A0A183VBT8_TOXCA|nr:unnamed protein product [Toxocara canis]
MYLCFIQIVHEEQSEDVFTHRNETIISTNKTDETSSSSEESSEEGSGKRLEGRNCEHEVEGHKCGHKQRDHKGRHGGDSVSSSDGQSHEVIERFSGEEIISQRDEVIDDIEGSGIHHDKVGEKLLPVTL